MASPDLAPLLALLHLCDSLLPIGAFAYSDGLEAATSAALVRDAGELGDWLGVCLDEGIGRAEGPALAMAWAAVRRDDWARFAAVNDESAALRPSSAIRLANRSMGMRLLKTWQAMHPDVRLDHAGAAGATLPLAFAAVSACAGIALRDALAGYAYTRLAATVSAAMRLMPLGQTEAHQLLSRALARVPAVIDEMIDRDGPIESFAPALDAAQMTQQYVHSRLFRS
jgi:urease accessory protein